MKITTAMESALAAGMCCYPWQVDFVPYLVGGWGIAATGEFWWCTPYPESQQHYHPLPADGRVVPLTGNSFQIIDTVDKVLAVFVPLAECTEVDVGALAETFARYRASLLVEA